MGGVCLLLTRPFRLARWRRAETCPKRAGDMVAVAEPGGTVLITEDGRGTRADRGGRLGPVAEEIWRLADGTRTTDQIARAIAAKYGIPGDVAARDTQSFIDVLVRHGFLVM